MKIQVRAVAAHGLLSLVAVLCFAVPAPASAQDATALRERHAVLKDKLAANQFGRPLVLESKESSGDLRGDVYTVVEHPYPVVQRALQSVEHWCDILILHLNVKHCRAAGTGNKSLALSVGRKFDQPLEEAYKLEFGYKVAAATPDYLQVQLSADEGPLSTKNYRILVEAVPVDAARSFIHMSYAYGYGFAAKMALQTYLATMGRDKVGFTIVERKPDGTPVYLGSVLGLLERNTMRYYLAIDAYLGAYAAAPAEQVERRVRAWYASTERYARQLHEMEEADYVEMKRKEIKRQNEGTGAKTPL